MNPSDSEGMPSAIRFFIPYRDFIIRRRTRSGRYTPTEALYSIESTNSKMTAPRAPDRDSSRSETVSTAGSCRAFVRRNRRKRLFRFLNSERAGGLYHRRWETTNVSAQTLAVSRLKQSRRRGGVFNSSVEKFLENAVAESASGRETNELVLFAPRWCKYRE